MLNAAIFLVCREMFEDGVGPRQQQLIGRRVVVEYHGQCLGGRVARPIDHALLRVGPRHMDDAFAADSLIVHKHLVPKSRHLLRFQRQFARVPLENDAPVASGAPTRDSAIQCSSV